jgi:hypothetical protein
MEACFRRNIAPVSPELGFIRSITRELECFRAITLEAQFIENMAVWSGAYCLVSGWSRGENGLYLRNKTNI